jgi:hypothetical protein
LLSRGFAVDLNGVTHKVNLFEGMRVSTNIRTHSKLMRDEVERAFELARSEWVAMMVRLSAAYRTTHTRELTTNRNGTVLESTFTPRSLAV